MKTEKGSTYKSTSIHPGIIYSGVFLMGFVMGALIFAITAAALVN